ncbi:MULTISPECIES: hypothetical protein [unclassified Roseobacter]|uniref:hypothetical protein n=2 Tax=unclassified Roseobacter TaxID=196798 RepID=UPI001491D2E8|nr:MULTISPECIES: hypothetical protein [unclassified Roseobacter]MBF9051727.1 hypothetical protein [Rhodobacterales bacterium HKCCD4356]NNW29541.1 hypothetical protein [Roseobacter sp. HKCCD8381]NNW88002.1 hypothetical protein [Roseobacter sp. HKCCD8272]NNW97734.1 hypothetical protein [Roseobacter sp. HKCCD9159]NNX06248.1 hypothetical protein [Roseobacter sp. HKCCD5919]NNX14742.1 hypothetical protein [Roseobacter sp. HKCCD8769]NNX57557.1 hypothetical protein [Roseobacter sp. HKCCD8812]NNY424
MMSRTAAFHNGSARLNVAVPLHAPAALLVVELDQLVRTWRDDTDLVLAMAGSREVVLDGFFDVEERAILTREPETGEVFQLMLDPVGHTIGVDWRSSNELSEMFNTGAESRVETYTLDADGWQSGHSVFVIGEDRDLGPPPWIAAGFFGGLAATAAAVVAWYFGLSFWAVTVVFFGVEIVFFLSFAGLHARPAAGRGTSSSRA